MAAMNPMQKKANTSFMIGVLITLLITGAIIAFLVVQLMNIRKEQAAAEASKVDALVFSANVKSGESMVGKYETKRVDSSIVPSDATSTVPENGVAKVDLSAGTVLSQSMVTEEDVTNLENTRLQEYNMIILPSQLQDGDYIDIRLKLPSGLDFIVVAKKQVTIPLIGGSPSSTTIQLNMNEAETLAMSSAIVDAYIMTGSILYATTYTEPGIQEASTVTYAVSENSRNAIQGNPNIVQEAANAIVGQWANLGRDKIVEERNYYSDSQLSNIESGVSEQVSKALEERKAYLDALAGE